MCIIRFGRAPICHRTRSLPPGTGCPKAARKSHGTDFCRRDASERRFRPLRRNKPMSPETVVPHPPKPLLIRCYLNRSPRFEKRHSGGIENASLGFGGRDSGTGDQDLGKFRPGRVRRHPGAGRPGRFPQNLEGGIWTGASKASPATECRPDRRNSLRKS